MSLQTQRFLIVVSTDDDVEEREIGDVLDALGYHGLLVLDLARTDHECPCPSDRCVRRLRQEGHAIPEGVACCICWALRLTPPGEAHAEGEV